MERTERLSHCWVTVTNQRARQLEASVHGHLDSPIPLKIGIRPALDSYQLVPKERVGREDFSELNTSKQCQKTDSKSRFPPTSPASIQSYMTLLKVKSVHSSKMENGKELSQMFIEDETLQLSAGEYFQPIRSMKRASFVSAGSSRRPSDESVKSLNLPLDRDMVKVVTPRPFTSDIDNATTKNRSKSLVNISRRNRSPCFDHDGLGNIEESPKYTAYRRGSWQQQKADLPKLNNFVAIKDAFGAQLDTDQTITLPGTPLPSLVQNCDDEVPEDPPPMTPPAERSQNPNPDSLFFRDGRRKIDMVLVYEEEELGVGWKVLIGTGVVRLTLSGSFQENLVKEGLELELEHKELSFDGKTWFLKIHLPWKTKTRYAALMGMKLPVKRFITISVKAWGSETELSCIYYGSFPVSVPSKSQVVDCSNIAAGSRLEVRFFPKKRALVVDNVYAALKVSKLFQDDKKDQTKGLSTWQTWTKQWRALCEYNHELIPKEPSFYDATEGRDREEHVKTFRTNPVTREKEPYLPTSQKVFRMVITGSAVFFMVGSAGCSKFQWKNSVLFPQLFVVLAAVLGTIIYRLSLVTIIYGSQNLFLKNHAKIVTSVTAALINLIFIMSLTRGYHRLAIYLTNLESPRTTTEFEDSYTFKIFLFEFMNFYSSLIYIAFFKVPTQEPAEDQLKHPDFQGRFFDYPGDTISRKSEFFRVKGDICDPAGCLSELCIQLAIIMIGKQMLNNFVEIFNPYACTIWLKLLIFLSKFYNWWRYRSHRSNTKDLSRKHTRWEEDYHLQDPGRLALFDEYLEMIHPQIATGAVFGAVLQYGFVTLFVAAFPLAPLCALINNVAEIRLDAYKMVTQARRPLAERVEDIGAWYGILKAITYAAVVSNAFVIAYTSDFIPRMVYKYKYSAAEDLVGYIDSSLSGTLRAVFNTSDYHENMGPDDKAQTPDVCQYRGEAIKILIGIVVVITIPSEKVTTGITDILLPKMENVYHWLQRTNIDEFPDVSSTTALDIFKGDEAVGEVISRAFRLRRNCLTSRTSDSSVLVYFVTRYRNGPNESDPYGLSPQYWHVFAARLAFVVIFEHVVFALVGIMQYVIPDVPSELNTQIQRETLLAKEAKYEHGLRKTEYDYDDVLNTIRENDSRNNDSKIGKSTRPRLNSGVAWR
ncbi:hypothetical protein HUJ05_005938 [Dendroctonus ponderosae]|nr:hypothetical protein HUJ05_005938 [Dendroctonus ponderosae]